MANRNFSVDEILESVKKMQKEQEAAPPGYVSPKLDRPASPEAIDAELRAYRARSGSFDLDSFLSEKSAPPLDSGGNRGETPQAAAPLPEEDVKLWGTERLSKNAGPGDAGQTERLPKKPQPDDADRTERLSKNVRPEQPGEPEHPSQKADTEATDGMEIQDDPSAKWFEVHIPDEPLPAVEPVAETPPVIRTAPPPSDGARDARTMIEEDKDEAVFRGGEPLWEAPAADTGDDGSDLPGESFDAVTTEYEHRSEIEMLKGLLDTRRHAVTLRLVMTVLLLLIAAGTLMAGVAAIPFLYDISRGVSAGGFITANMILLAAAAVLCFDTVGGGLRAMFCLKPNSDTPTALAVVGAVFVGGFLFMNPGALEEPAVHFYALVALTGLVCNQAGKYFQTRRITKNFATLTGSDRLFAAEMVEQPEVITKLREPGKTAPVACRRVEAAFVERFFERSRGEDLSDRMARVSVPVTLMGAVVVGVLTWFLSRNLFTALTALSAILCVSAPFTTTLAVNVPMWRAARRLQGAGSMLIGPEDIAEYAKTEMLLISERDLMPEGSVMLHGIKTFDKHRIDEAIVEAVSLVRPLEGCLSKVFMNIIENRDELLHTMDSVDYEDGLGVVGWVGSRRILFGNRRLMIKNKIPVPSRDYEQRYDRDGRSLLYLAAAGELTALFILSYHPDTEISDVLYALVKNGVKVAVSTVDPGLTEERLSAIFEMEPGDIRVIDSGAGALLRQESGTEQRRMEAGAVSDGTFISFAAAILTAIRLKNPVTLAVILQTVGMILGYGLVTYFAFFSDLAQIGVLPVLCYQLFWAFFTWLFSNLTKI